MIKIGITLGDPVGVGPEILIKSFPFLATSKAKFIIFGDEALLLNLAKDFQIKIPSNVEIINLSSLKIIPGKPTKSSYEATIKYLQSAIEFLKKGEITGLVTLPISKEAFSALDLSHRGHTEFLAESFQVNKYAMTFYGKKIKVALATTHIPLKEVPLKINPEKIERIACLVYEFLRKTSKKRELKIALSALNPHAGENGLLGNEEILLLKPLVEKLQAKNIPIYGPIPADSLFYKVLNREYDFVIALYHDQGLIPFKLLHFRDGVNLTLGLPFVRTSPVHGTAYDIAGKGMADPLSFISAVKLALKLAPRW
ncbi:MAG: 4-hydroxythreonine-4-phosphate dehydrogenase PdxA [Caldimicrobium sp.]